MADRHEPSACLDLDWFFAKLRRGAIEPWRAEAHAQNRVVLHAAAEACAAFAAGGYFTVAEGILYPFMLDLFAAACARYGIALHYAVLRAPIEVVQQRVRDRRSNRSTRRRWPMRPWSTTCGRSSSSQGVDERHRVDVGARGSRRGGRGDRPPAAAGRVQAGGTLRPSAKAVERRGSASPTGL